MGSKISTDEIEKHTFHRSPPGKSCSIPGAQVEQPPSEKKTFPLSVLTSRRRNAAKTRLPVAIKVVKRRSTKRRSAGVLASALRSLGPRNPPVCTCPPRFAGYASRLKANTNHPHPGVKTRPSGRILRAKCRGLSRPRVAVARRRALVPPWHTPLRSHCSGAADSK